MCGFVGGVDCKSELENNGNFQRKIYIPLVSLTWFKRFFIGEGQLSARVA